MTERILYTRRQAVEEIGLSLSTIDQLLRDGKIVPRRHGRRVLIPRAELDKFRRHDGPKIWPPKQNGKTTRVAAMPKNKSAVA